MDGARRRSPGSAVLRGVSTWTLPGFDVEEMLGFGATGEVWRARDQTTGEIVALKRLRPGADPSAVEALHREAALLKSLDTPYVVRLREVLGDVLVLDHAPGGSLATLLLRRGSLEPGEVVTIGAPLASALAAAHAAGLVHGDVSPANVLFTAEGMPLLADLGVARVAGGRRGVVDGTAEYVDPAVAAGGTPDRAADVWALGAVCHQMLAGTPPHDGHTVDQVLAAAVAGERAPLGLLAPLAPRALVAVVEAALSGDAARRPTAAALAVALQRAHTAAPVRLTGPPSSGALPDLRETHVVPRPPRPPDEHAAPARWRPSAAALAAVCVVLVLLVAGLRWARSAQPAPVQALPAASPSPAASPGPSVSPWPSVSPGPSPAPTPVVDAMPAWERVLAELDGLREQAFARGDPALLDRVYTPGPTQAADAAALRALTGAGRTATGVRHEVRQVAQTSSVVDRAELRVVDVLSPQVVRDGQGAVVESRPGRGEMAYDVVLVRRDGAWRIATLTPV